jgi:tRNA threonylcarbamoyladenosine biosynthesis protein TsaB
VLVLALESATEMAGAALADERGVLAAAAVAGRRHGESLAPAVEFVCARAGVSLGELGGLCVDVGPGLFTGLRVGVATAKGLAFGLGLPVAEVGSLELLAASAAAWEPLFAGGPPQLVPVVDARRGLVFSARFEAGAGDGPGTPGAGRGGPALRRVGDDKLSAPEQLAEELSAVVRAGRRVVAFGDGARRYRQLLAAAGVALAGHLGAPDTGMLAVLGVERVAAGAVRPAAEVTARYLRPADVRINWERRMTRRPSPPPPAPSPVPGP